MESQILSKAMKESSIEWESEPKPTPHDLRRTCITGISCLGFSRLVQDKVANHIDSSVGGIYDRNDYAKEKQQAMEAWERKLSEIIHGQASSNVLTFRQA
jgi:integrase